MSTHTGTGRVLHAIKRHGEFSQTFIADAMSALDRIGWEAWVLSEFAPAEGAAAQFPPAHRVLRLQRPSVARRAINHAARRDVRRRTSDWWLPAIREVRPTLIHAHFGWTAARPELRALGVPTLVSFHGSDVNAWPHRSPARMSAYRSMFRELERATAVSEFIAGRLRGLGYAGRIDIVPPGVRLEEFAYRDPRSDLEDARLLFVGRHVSCKGLDTLLEALPRVASVVPSVRLEVIGDGAERQENETRAQRLGIERLVEFRGFRSHAEVADSMHRADMIVVPSRRSATGEEEGSPVAPKEALATGTALVATNVGGMRETVPPTMRRELVPANDPEALAARIVEKLQTPESWGASAREGRAWVEQHFDWTQLADRLGAIYGEMAVAPAGVPPVPRQNTLPHRVD